MAVISSPPNNGDGEEPEVKWLGQYSSEQSILLVGEGDFSFSLSLATAFTSAANLVATSLDSYEMLLKKYRNVEANLEALKRMDGTVLHGVDATRMRFRSELKMRRFDRIVFNFPHAGFNGKEDRLDVINLHRSLVMGFFKNARIMLRPFGEVHVSHKTGGPFRKWNIQELASKSSLVLTEHVDFSINDYPGYSNKRGDGRDCDEPFPLGQCSTYKFRIGKVPKKKRVLAGVGFSSFPFPSIRVPGVDPLILENSGIPFHPPGILQTGYYDGTRPQTHFFGNMHEAPRVLELHPPHIVQRAYNVEVTPIPSGPKFYPPEIVQPGYHLERRPPIDFLVSAGGVPRVLGSQPITRTTSFNLCMPPYHRTDPPESFQDDDHFYFARDFQEYLHRKHQLCTNETSFQEYLESCYEQHVQRMQQLRRLIVMHG